MPAGQGVLDHGVCGLATVRLIDPPHRIAESLAPTLGTSSGATAEPDVVVRFVDRLPAERLRLLELNDAAFDDERFYVVDAFGARTRLEVDRIGEAGLELVCERRVREIPLLLPIVALGLLGKGHVLLHSAAFVHRNRAFLAAGWKKGGKTELLLAYLSNGAAYLADEWTLVSPDGTARGLSGPLRVWRWHLQQLPEARRRIAPRARARLALAGAYRRAYALLPEPRPKSGLLRQRFDRLAQEGGVPWLGQVSVPADTLFPHAAALEPVRLDVAVLVQAASEGTEIMPSTGAEIARRMVASQEYERALLRTTYEQFRFAFPGRQNPLLEGAASEELRILEQAFRGVLALELRHPYPVDLQELYALTQEVAAEPPGPS